MSVSVRIDGRIATVTIDNPPVNAISHGVRAGLMDAVARTNAADIDAVILCAAGRTFVAGADVREFDQPPAPPHLPDVFAAIEAANRVWIAALHGTVLGGGLELALACAYRVAAPGTKLGLPEVHLGLIPGAGGTVRLPRLVAPEVALEMITSGRPVAAARAMDVGLVDALAGGDSADDLAQAARDLAATPRPRPAALLDRAPMPTGPDWAQKLQAARARARGQNSVLAAVDAVDRSLAKPGQAALADERAAFLALKADPQSAALRYMFFAERSVAKAVAKPSRPARAPDIIGVIGGGTMGAGIAGACLLAGLPVRLIEQDGAAADAANRRVTAILDGAVARGKLTPQALRAAQARCVVATDTSALAQADLVIEAVFEDFAVKADVFARLDAHCRADTVLATNTSYLDVTALAAATKHPQRVIGLHFFSPAHVMKLLEVITPPNADARAVAVGLGFAKRLGKVAVPAGVCDGFIGNRIMAAYRREADYMIEDGAWPQDVDAAMRAFGFPMGVFQMQDLAGLDIGFAMRKRRAATRPESERYVAIADDLVQAGRLGRKAGRGWYDYSNDPKGAVDPAVLAMIEAASARRGITRRAMTGPDIMDRLLRVMQSEGRAILAEGIAAGPEAVDVVMVNGFGFPRWRGGPMFMQGGGAEK